MTAPLPPALKEQVAQRMFAVDWPNDTWEKHIVRGEPDAALRRYLAMAEEAVALTLAFGEGEMADLKLQLRIERESVKTLATLAGDKHQETVAQAARIEMLEVALKQAAELASHPLQMTEPLKNFADIREVARNNLGERK